MVRSSPAPAISLLLAIFALGGCQQPAPVVAPQERSFSAEDKRVAKLLSLGGMSKLEEGGSPLEQAVLCRFVIGELRTRLDQAGALNAETSRGFEMVSEAYDRRIRAAAGSQALPSGNDLAESLDEAARGQLALSCVERLQPRS